MQKNKVTLAEKMLADELLKHKGAIEFMKKWIEEGGDKNGGHA